MASKRQSGQRKIVQKPFRSKELEHGEQATIRSKEYRAKAVPLEGARTWRASNNQAEGILIDYHREAIRKLISP